jgi:hypothetical protein
MITVITAETHEAAHEKLRDYRHYVSAEGALALMSGCTGVDFSTLPPDEPVRFDQRQAMTSALEDHRRPRAQLDAARDCPACGNRLARAGRCRLVQRSCRRTPSLGGGYRHRRFQLGPCGDTRSPTSWISSYRSCSAAGCTSSIMLRAPRAKSFLGPDTLVCPQTIRRRGSA